MFRVLFVFFIVIPIIEIAVLMQVGDLLGLWPTIAIVVFTAWLGAKNVRQQGLATMASVQAKMAQGQMPSDEIVAGLLLLVAGVLLVTPGFVTDIFGLSLLIPQVRLSLIKRVQKHLVVNKFGAGAGFQQQGFSQESGNVYEHECGDVDTFQPEKIASHHKAETIEGDFERKD
jgi:UPF0716 protein FxsA